MKFLRNISTIAAAVMMFTINVDAAQPVAVKLNSVKNSYEEYVDFKNTAPVVINDVTMAPIRTFAQNAGMEVEWDQTTLTALVSINLEEHQEAPIVEYANELIAKVSNYGLELTPKRITAALQSDNQNGIIRYVFTDSEGDEVCIGKEIDMGAAPKFIEGHVLVAPIRSMASMFGLDVEWSQEDLAVVISIPETVVAPMDVEIIPNHQKKEEEQAAAVVEEQESGDTYLGTFKITHYCPCAKCCGVGGGNTAWAGKLNPGQSIAVDKNVIPKLSWVYIDGYGMRRAEDTGGAIKGNRIDVAVPTHAEAIRLGVVYKDVWLQS